MKYSIVSNVINKYGPSYGQFEERAKSEECVESKEQGVIWGH